MPARTSAQPAGAPFLLETLPVTLFIIARHGDDPDRAVRAAIYHTRDNDTITSLVASAMGALHGMDAFRPDWVEHLLGRTGSDDDGRVQELVARAGQGVMILDERNAASYRQFRPGAIMSRTWTSLLDGWCS